MALIDVALFVSSSSESNIEQHHVVALAAVSSEERIDEEAPKNHRWPPRVNPLLTPVRARSIQQSARNWQRRCGDRALKRDVEDVDRSVFSVVRSVIAVDSDVLLFVRIRQGARARKIPTLAVSRSGDRTDCRVGSSCLPQAGRRARLLRPARHRRGCPNGLYTGERIRRAGRQTSSRTDPMSAEKASEVRASVTSALAVSSDADRSSAAVSSSPSVAPSRGHGNPLRGVNRLGLIPTGCPTRSVPSSMPRCHHVCTRSVGLIRDAHPPRTPSSDRTSATVNT